MEIAVSVGLIATCTSVGAVLGHWMFALAQRDERTVLPVQWRPAMAAVTAVVCGAIAWRFGFSWALPAFLALPLFGVLLATVDLRSKLLPNALMFPFFLTATVLLVPAAALSGGWNSLLGTVIGGASLFIVYLVLALISPSGLGMGDVKLAGVLGLYAGYIGPAAWSLIALGGFILGGVMSVFLLLFTRFTRKSAFPFGPAMLAAALAAAIWA